MRQPWPEEIKRAHSMLSKARARQWRHQSAEEPTLADRLDLDLRPMLAGPGMLTALVTESHSLSMLGGRGKMCYSALEAILHLSTSLTRIQLAHQLSTCLHLNDIQTKARDPDMT